MMAWRRWVISAAATGSSVSVKNGWYRHTGNSASGKRASLTRRTISRAVRGWAVELNAG
ncbi:Uncharacterised protein [Mycobacteroides abscessus subsp. abscessus]|nr:Uncharacterised protein [Mycobacteroides abscessus subsp. abscessus]